MSTSLPIDQNNHPIPVLRLKDDGAHKITASAASTRNAAAFPETTQIISLYATVPVYVRLGDATATATPSDHYFPAGVYYDMSLGGDGSAHKTHIAILREFTDGTVYISEKV